MIPQNHPLDSRKSHFFHEGHFHEHYDDWRMRRIRKVMEIYGSDFRGKRVLELGGGLGDTRLNQAGGFHRAQCSQDFMVLRRIVT